MPDFTSKFVASASHAAAFFAAVMGSLRTFAELNVPARIFSMTGTRSHSPAYGTLTASALKANTSAPGFALMVAGNAGTGPLVEVKNQGNEATIRYVNNDGVAWHAGAGGTGGAKNFFFWNDQKNVVATITPDGILTASVLKANTNAPGFALMVAGNTGTAPLVEVKNQGNEATIRYVNSDGTSWHVGSGGAGGAKNFFFWNDVNGVVGTITPDGTVTMKGGLTVNNIPTASTAPAQNRLKQLMIDPDTGKIYRAN